MRIRFALLIIYYTYILFTSEIRKYDKEVATVTEALFKAYKKGSSFTNQLNVKAFKKYLTNSRDKNINFKFIKNGFPLYLTTREPRNLSTKISNWARNKKELIKIIKQFTKECENGAIIPSTKEAKYNINVFTVPKKDASTGEYTKLRVVRHGSYNTKNTTSINHWIDDKKCKMPTLPNLKDYVRILIDKNWMSLRDLSDAFRQICLAQEDVGYLGYSIFGLKFIDMKQPYGIASAAANCQSFAQHLIWILEQHKLPQRLKDSILVHIDDFSLPTKTKEDAILMAKRFDELCEELNVIISVDKNVDVTQVAELYGFLWDLKNKTVAIPIQKRESLKRFIILVIQYRIISGRALESLCGKLMHWSQLYKPAKPLCYNMLGFIYQNIRKNKNLKRKWFRIPDSIIMDLKFWLKYIDILKEVKMERILYIPSIQINGTSDASSFGAGYCVGNMWSNYRFTRRHRDRLHINQKEAHVILTLIETLKHSLTGRRLILYVDNTSVFYAMCNRWAGPQLMPFIYETSLKMMEYRIEIWFEWIPTQNNLLADTLSRFQTREFWEWVNLYNMQIDSHKTISNYVHNLTLNPNFL